MRGRLAEPHIAKPSPNRIHHLPSRTLQRRRGRRTKARPSPAQPSRWYVRDRDADVLLKPSFLCSIGEIIADNCVLQVRYAAHIEPAKSARSRGSYLRVSYKNTRETAQAINGWKLSRAVTFLENVQEHKEAVPMRRYAGGTGRTAQGTSSHRVW